MERGLVEEAAGAFAQAQALMPKSEWPLVWRASAQAARGACEEPARAAQILTEALSRWPWGRLTAAWAALCRGDDRRAVSELDEALRLSSEFPEAALLKADILLDRGQYDELGRIIRPMLDQKVVQVDGNILLARSFLQQGKPDLAADIAEGAIRFNQRDHRAFSTLALARAAAGDLDGARRAFENALRLNGFDSQIAAEDAWFRGLSLKDGDAAATFRRLTERDPRNAAVWLLWGDYQMKSGAYSDAVQSFQTAIALRPYLLRAHLGLVEANVKLGALDRAESALIAAAAVNSRNKDVAVWRARMRRS
jgi:predicted Zn-dependent protease